MLGRSSKHRTMRKNGPKPDKPVSFCILCVRVKIYTRSYEPGFGLTAAVKALLKLVSRRAFREKEEFRIDSNDFGFI